MNNHEPAYKKLFADLKQAHEDSLAIDALFRSCGYTHEVTR